MKKVIIIIISSLFSLTLNAQNMNKIKSQNIFFILFENDEFTRKIDLSRITNKEEYYKYVYFFKNKDKFDYSFMYWKYRNFDDAYNKINETPLFRINKSFLRKNRDIIITREFMEKEGKETMLSLLYDNRSNKTIFIINTAETKNGKILLREVDIDYMADE